MLGVGARALNLGSVVCGGVGGVIGFNLDF